MGKDPRKRFRSQQCQICGRRARKHLLHSRRVSNSNGESWMRNARTHTLTATPAKNCRTLNRPHPRRLTLGMSGSIFRWHLVDASNGLFPMKFVDSSELSDGKKPLERPLGNQFGCVANGALSWDLFPSAFPQSSLVRATSDMAAVRTIHAYTAFRNGVHPPDSRDEAFGSVANVEDSSHRAMFCLHHASLYRISAFGDGCGRHAKAHS